MEPFLIEIPGHVTWMCVGGFLTFVCMIAAVGAIYQISKRKKE